MKFAMENRIDEAQREAEAVLAEAGLPTTPGRRLHRQIRSCRDRMLRTAFHILSDCHHLRQRIEHGETEAAAELAWKIGATLSNLRILHAVPE